MYFCHTGIIRLDLMITIAAMKIMIVIRMMLIIMIMVTLMIMIITLQLPADDEILKIEHTMHHSSDYPYVSTFTVRMILFFLAVMNPHMYI